MPGQFFSIFAFLIYIYVAFKLAVPFQCTSENTTSIMYPTSGKVGHNGITTYTISANRTRKRAVFCYFSSIFTTNHYFCLLKIRSQHTFNFSATFQASSLPFFCPAAIYSFNIAVINIF